MNWYRLTSRDAELITVERMETPQPWIPDYGRPCRHFGEDHVCIVQAETIDAAIPMRCTKSMMR
jgi:hypothetical protein